MGESALAIPRLPNMAPVKQAAQLLRPIITSAACAKPVRFGL